MCVHFSYLSVLILVCYGFVICGIYFFKGLGQHMSSMKYSKVSPLGFIIFSVFIPPIGWSRRFKVQTIGGHISSGGALY